MENKNNFAIKIYNEWVNRICDKKIAGRLIRLSEKDIVEGFCNKLSFGTAGMRGVMGMGTNKINVLTVTKLAYAICQYINTNCSNKSVVIGFDTRHNSKDFSRVFAKACTYQNVKVNLFKNFCPTPVLSYAITKTNSEFGIMITASHNNKIYNGIKVSDKNGIQISGDVQQKISAIYDSLDEVSVYNQIYENRKKIIKNITFLDKKLEKEYICCKNSQKQTQNIKIVYTPLNGTGLYCVSNLLKDNGYKIVVPKSQKYPNGDFTTCPYPNPEFVEAFKESILLAQKIDADLIIATDPDADRLGAMVKHNGEYVKLSGNEVGYLLLENQIQKNKAQKRFAVSSVVTSPLFLEICKQNNVDGFRTLTGFKNIGKKMFELKKEYKKGYTLGYEESCGYIVRDDLLDKDGIFACLELCNIANALKEKNLTLVDKLEEMYQKYGYLSSVSDNIIFEGSFAIRDMNNVVDSFRECAPKQILGEKVENITDYLDSEKTKLEKQNFLEYKTNSITIIVRPSGTEPKLKLYCFASGENMKVATDKANQVILEFKNLIKEKLGK